MVFAAGLAGLLLSLSPCSTDEAALRRDPQDAQRYLKLVECWLNAGERGRWSKVLPPAQATVPSPLRFALGIQLAQHQLYGEAIEQFETIPEKDRDEAVTFNLGLAYSHRWDYAAARRYYFATIDRDANHTEAYFRIGLDFAATTERNKAIPWLLRARRMAPGRSDIAYALAAELIGQRYFQSAEAILSSAIVLHPADALLRSAQGDLAMEQQNISRAIQEYRTAIELNPSIAAASVGLARAFVQQQQPDEAKRILQEVVARDARNAAAHALLGQLAIDSATWDTAIGHLEAAAKSDPLNMKVIVSLARCYRAKAQPGKALLLLQKNSIQGVADRSYHLELARNLRAVGRVSEAEREMKHAQQIEESQREVLAFVPPTVYIH